MGAVGKRCLKSRNGQSVAEDHVNTTLGEVSAERGEATVL